MKNKLIALSGLALSFVPVVVLAQTTGGFTSCTTQPITTFPGMICKVSEILGYIIPLLIGLGMVYFVWGVVSYVIASDEEAKTKGRDRIIYGIIGLAVIISVWGLVAVLKNTFGLQNNQNITFPTVPF